jgi:hypothetical protein
MYKQIIHSIFSLNLLEKQPQCYTRVVIKITTLFALLFFIASGCGEQPDFNNNDEISTISTRTGEGDLFYYYGYEDKKIFLKQKTNTILLRRSEVISATYLLENDRGLLSGITNEFAVGLGVSTSYAQLQELAEKHHCIVGEKYSYDFLKNVFRMYVSKASELTAMQAANLFYETELFGFAEPNFITFSSQTFVNDPYYPQQWALKNTVSNGGVTALIGQS